MLDLFLVLWNFLVESVSVSGSGSEQFNRNDSRFLNVLILRTSAAHQKIILHQCTNTSCFPSATISHTFAAHQFLHFPGSPIHCASPGHQYLTLPQRTNTLRFPSTSTTHASLAHQYLALLQSTNNSDFPSAPIPRVPQQCTLISRASA